MINKQRETEPSTEIRRFREQLSTVVGAMRTAAHNIAKARLEFDEEDFEIRRALMRAACAERKMRNRVYEAGCLYWLRNSRE